MSVQIPIYSCRAIQIACTWSAYKSDAISVLSVFGLLQQFRIQSCLIPLNLDSGNTVAYEVVCKHHCLWIFLFIGLVSLLSLLPFYVNFSVDIDGTYLVFYWYFTYSVQIDNWFILSRSEKKFNKVL